MKKNIVFLALTLLVTGCSDAGPSESTITEMMNKEIAAANALPFGNVMKLELTGLTSYGCEAHPTMQNAYACDVELTVKNALTGEQIKRENIVIARSSEGELYFVK